MVESDIKRILFSQDIIQERVRQIGKQITDDFGSGTVTVIAALKGAFVFAADLVRAIALPCEIDFLTVQSYGNNAVSGELSLKSDICIDISGKNIVIIDDILDTGKTMTYLKELFAARHPAAIKTCVLLDKKTEKPKAKADYYGFEISNEFVVGYGLDYAQKYRNLPYIGVLDEKVYNK